MDKQQYSSSPCSSESTDHMPLFKLLAFTMAGFLTIMTETMPAGLLPQISQGLQISQAQAGQLISIFAFGSAVAAIPIIYLTQSCNRRPLFLVAIAGLFIFNSLTALSDHYWLTLIVRFVGGMCAGIIWGLLAGYARRLVPTHLQGRALAIAGVGQPIALSLGVPLQTALADTAGENADIAQSMLVTVFNFAIACGGFVGGYLLEHYGAKIFPSSMLIFILFSLVIVCLGKKHGFKIGHRPSKQH
ncbi:MFS transporter [Acinetobacter gerneri]|uniref:MFS transporter n=1 Tax=Acinetobacter gerneri TaxID=202952 RepID=UPI003214AA0B